MSGMTGIPFKLHVADRLRNPSEVLLRSYGIRQSRRSRDAQVQGAPSPDSKTWNLASAIVRTCRVCGAELFKPKQGPWPTYCGMRCRASVRPKRVKPFTDSSKGGPRICVCGVLVNQIPGKGRARKFCSPICAHRALKRAETTRPRRDQRKEEPHG